MLRNKFNQVVKDLNAEHYEALIKTHTHTHTHTHTQEDADRWKDTFCS